MAETIAKLRVPEIIGNDRLLRELLLNQNTGRAICIIGEAGTGKTVAVENFAEQGKFEKYFEVKLAGCSSEDK